MPRRNLYLLLAVALVSIVCYQKVQKNRYGQILADVIDEVQRRYVEPVQASELFEGAADGILGRLDEYSRYISPTELPSFQEDIDRQFEGVGMEIELDPKTKQLLVISPVVGSPAYEAGIRAGDRVLKIDGHDTKGMAMKDAVARIRGKPGESVVITILREGAQKPVDIPIVRAIVHVDTVWGDTRNRDGTWNFFLDGHDHIGYLRVTSFGEKTSQELAVVLQWLAEHQVRGLILDLRNDPGGLLDEAVKVCDLLIDSGVIVTTRGRGGVVKRTEEAAHTAVLKDVPIAVLVNQYSASASEIVAACLQDHGRAAIVGQQTWGKGTVQEVIPLRPGQDAIKLTTGSYWRPSGRNIQRPRNSEGKGDWGVMPDKGYEVVVDREEFERWTRWRLRRDGKNPPDDAAETKKDSKPFVDRPLAKAVEYLQQAAAARH